MQEKDRKKIKTMCDAIFGIGIGSEVKLKKGENYFINLDSRECFRISRKEKGIVKEIRPDRCALVYFKKRDVVLTKLSSLEIWRRNE